MSHGLNRGEIRILARKRLGETTAAFWTDDELNGWINLACNDLAFRVKCLKADGFFSASAVVENTTSQASNEYSLEGLFPDLYSITEVYFHIEGSRWDKLESINFTDLDILFPGWRDDVGRTIPPTQGTQFTVTGITQANPAVVTTSAPHGFADDEAVILTGVVGMTEINGTTYYVKSSPTATTLELEESPAGPDLDSTGFTAYASGGTINTIGDTTYNFDSRPGVPTHYYWDRERDLFGLWLPPDALNETSNNVHVYYLARHADLGDDAEFPTIPEPLRMAIIDHVVYTGYESRGWGDKANDALAQYLAKISDYIGERDREREDEVLVAKNYRNVTSENQRQGRYY
jgi:hypothetical protein